MNVRDLKHLPSVLTAHGLARAVLYERARRGFRPLTHTEKLAVEVIDSAFDEVLREAERRLASRTQTLHQVADNVRAIRPEVAA